jgi:predicted RNase H-like HicB family nuclease
VDAGSARCGVNYQIEFEQEEDGRWIADIPELPGVMAYGSSKREAESKVQAIALCVIAENGYAIRV